MTISQLRQSPRLSRYINMRREERRNERQPARCVGYVLKLIVGKIGY